MHDFNEFEDLCYKDGINISDVSPRISEIHSSCTVNIRRNNDPYGVLSMLAVIQEPDYKASEPSLVELSIRRTGKRIV